MTMRDEFEAIITKLSNTSAMARIELQKFGGTREGEYMDPVVAWCWEMYLEKQATVALEALVKERDEVVADLEQTYVKAYERGKQDGLRDGEQRGLEEAAKVAEETGRIYADGWKYPDDKPNIAASNATFFIVNAIRKLLEKQP